MGIFMILLLCLTILKKAELAEEQDDDCEWNEYKQKYERKYSDEDDGKRRLTWKSSSDYVNQHNTGSDSGQYSYRLTMNHFSDLDPDEIRSKYLGGKWNKDTQKKSDDDFVVTEDMCPLPGEVDWDMMGYITPVKNQGECGACWAFTTTGALEAHYALKTGKLVRLSEQNLIDCVEDVKGCEGGWMGPAFDYIKQNGGIAAEDSYPYETKDGQCRHNQTKPAAHLTSWRNIPSGDEDALLAAVATVGPVAVTVSGSEKSFLFYQSGIYDDANCSTTKHDHTVVVVGYGTTNGWDWWKLKNSWGTGWGEDGFMFMIRNKNMCGIATAANFPVV